MADNVGQIPQIYPLVSSILQPDKRSVGPYPSIVPRGVLVHDTADRDLPRVIRSLDQKNLAYHLIIDRAGKVTQLCWLDRRVNHAGAATWGGLSPNQCFASVAILSWGGPLAKTIAPDGTPIYKSWSGAVIPNADVAMRRDNLSPTITPWDAATPAQEATLLQVLRWFMLIGKIPRNMIAGHDEAAIPHGRKDDPGGMIQWTMRDLRKLL